MTKLCAPRLTRPLAFMMSTWRTRLMSRLLRASPRRPPPRRPLLRRTSRKYCGHNTWCTTDLWFHVPAGYHVGILSPTFYFWWHDLPIELTIHLFLSAFPISSYYPPSTLSISFYFQIFFLSLLVLISLGSRRSCVGREKSYSDSMAFSFSVTRGRKLWCLLASYLLVYYWDDTSVI